MLHFQVKALDHQQFLWMDQATEEELAQRGVKVMMADKYPGYPCRVTLEDALEGDTLYLFSHLIHDTASPYRAISPIFVRKGYPTKTYPIDELPEMLTRRLLSIRVYDKYGMMLKGEVLQGTELRAFLETSFNHEKTAYIHVHNARQGCFNCVVERVG